MIKYYFPAYWQVTRPPDLFLTKGNFPTQQSYVVAMPCFSRALIHQTLFTAITSEVTKFTASWETCSNPPTHKSEDNDKIAAGGKGNRKWNKDYDLADINQVTPRTITIPSPTAQCDSVLHGPQPQKMVSCG